jgi:hypothetical protein
MATERVIGVWADAFGSNTSKWIVSRDTLVDGEPDETTTVRYFGDYESAERAAIDLAKQEGLRAIRVDRGGEVTFLDTPAD